MKVYMRTRHSRRSTRRAVYASVYDAKTRELLVSSLLDYALNAIEERGYILVEDPEDA